MIRLVACICILLSLGANSLDLAKKTESVKDSCGQCLMVRSSSNSVVSAIPWLFNSAKFYYSHTDGEGNRVWQANVGNKAYFMHWYDEGVFYDGFWVVNDDDSGYVEETGRVFVYTTSNGRMEKSSYCPVDSGNNWYYFTKGDWVFDASISVDNCVQ